MYEQFTGGQTVILMSVMLNSVHYKTFKFKKSKLGKHFFRKLICCREST